MDKNGQAIPNIESIFQSVLSDLKSSSHSQTLKIPNVSFRQRHPLSEMTLASESQQMYDTLRGILMRRLRSIRS
ncbi:hypothetical protein NPIL_679281 [Nephila pilipes]|uniref:Uncharacterized protein n=1 Tax=Nephila pilipes TaxID=299642 RepID=A0A8X6NL93_NEPPI|nr:hypothetical protein NPIL_679281 [Nephila pilipes]